MQAEINLDPENLSLPLKTLETVRTVLQKAAELLELAELAGEKEVQLAQEYAAVIDELQAASTWSELERACRQGEKTAYTRLSGGKKDPAGQEARDAFKHGRDQLKKQLEKISF